MPPPKTIKVPTVAREVNVQAVSLLRPVYGTTVIKGISVYKRRGFFKRE